MIVKNEEQHLARCLHSAKPLVDEIIVVDTGSSDRTKDIARVFGARIFDHVWNNDFSAARNISLEKASGDWIFVLDADEVLSPQDIPRLKEIIGNDLSRRSAYDITTRNYVVPVSVAGWNANRGDYGEEAGSGWYPSTKVRLFPNLPSIRFSNPVHELVEASLAAAGIPVVPCPVPVHHYGKLEMKHIRAKGEEYFLLGIEKLKEGETLKALIELATQAGEIGRYVDAADLWGKVVHREPGNANAFHNLSFSLLQLGRYSDALEAARAAIRLSPGLRDAEINIAIAHISLGQEEKATRLLEKLCRKHPDYAAALVMLAICRFMKGEGERGRETVAELRTRGIPFIDYVEDEVRHLLRGKQFAAAETLLDAVVGSVEGGQKLSVIREQCRVLARAEKMH
jgi:glycosyltransferase involved in cell wall biosynthesis